MKKVIIFSFSFFVFFILRAQNPVWQRSNSSGGTMEEKVYGSYTDTLTGATYITGIFYGTATFGSINLVSAGDGDAFIVKYDSTGSVIWAKGIGGAALESGGGVGIDGSGNCYWSGNFFSAAITFGSLPVLSNADITTTTRDIFLVKYDVSGNEVWAKRFGSNGNDGSNRMFIEPTGNIYMAGNFENTLTLGSLSSITSAGSADIFVAKFDLNGDPIWVRRGGGSSLYDTPYDIRVDKFNNCYITGYFTGPATFGALPANSVGGFDIFIAKYNSTTGNEIWIKSAGGSGNEISYGMDIGKDGDIVITGFFENTATFGSLIPITTFGARDIFIAKYDTLSGNAIWSKRAGGSGNDYSDDITIDCGGNIYVVTAFEGSANFGGTIINSAGNSDVGIAKYGPSGNIIWVERAGGGGIDDGKGIGLDKFNNCYVTGRFSNSFSFGSLAPVLSAGSTDVFITKLSSTSDCPLNIISGNIYEDSTSNCVKDVGERGLRGVIKITPGPIYGLSKANGDYSINVKPGTYVVSQMKIGELWLQNCSPASYTVNMPDNTISTSLNNDFANEPILCPILDVDISTARLRRCFLNTYSVQYCNRGTASANNVEVKVEFPGAIISKSSSIPWIQNDNQYTFNIGTVNAGVCGSFTIVDSVSCIVPLGSSYCVKAWISPDTICTPVSPVWDRSSVKVLGECVGDSVVSFLIINTGDPMNGDMDGPSEYRIYADNKLAYTGQFQIAGGDTLVVELLANGQTIRLEADQRLGHPGKSHPRETIEACGTGNGGAISFGFLTQVGEDDEDEKVEIDCQTVIGSYDPNDKSAMPEGITSNHYIFSTDELEYKIRFQNTGTDTAFTVVIRDTLSNYLDVSSLKMGSASHGYTYTIIGEINPVIQWEFNNINLPDSNINELGSNGYLTFKIKQIANNSKGTLIQNRAGIIFDYNNPVITNYTNNIVYDTIIAGPALMVLGTIPVKYNNALDVSVHPNPFNDGAYFSLNGFNQSQKMVFELCDISGKVQRNFALSESDFYLSKDSLPPGIYIYKISSDQGLLCTGKLIIQ